tara:strand:+ start:222 stop:554 length:333 start_codon:yes stop_codon:yes gene_type:complete
MQKARIKGIIKSTQQEATMESYNNLNAVLIMSDPERDWKDVIPADGKSFNLGEVQKLVGGYVERVSLPNNQIMLIDEDGMMKRLPLNREASHLAGHTIAGPVLVMSSDMF